MSAYIIQQDDTLFTIAEEHTGNGNRYTEILPLNPQITDPDVIIEGAMIQLPDSWSGSSSNLPAPAPRPAVTPLPSSPSAPAAATTAVKADTILQGTLLALVILGGGYLLWKKPQLLGFANPEEGEVEAEDTEAEDFEEEDFEEEDQED